MSTREFLDLEPAQSARRIPYDTAKVVPGIVPGTWILIVSGETACVNMTAQLSPLVYITCPEYWGIEVVGTLDGPCIVGIVPTPYSVSIQLTGITGSKGIEVLGAKSEQIEVEGGCESSFCFEAADKV